MWHYANSEPESQEASHVYACLLALLPSPWEHAQASWLMELRHMEQGLVVPITSAKANIDQPTPSHWNKCSQNQQSCGGDHTDSRCISGNCWLLVRFCDWLLCSITVTTKSCTLYKKENRFKEVNFEHTSKPRLISVDLSYEMSMQLCKKKGCNFHMRSIFYNHI
jgi:hypothetical protein